MTLDSSLSAFSAAQNLVSRNRQGFRGALENQGIAPADIDFIIRYSILDSSVLLARNPRYQRLPHSFAHEIQMRGWDERIAPEMAAKHPYQHQVDGFSAIAAGQHTVIATGTGSGKSETFLLPLLNTCARTQGGVVALLIYPMKSLANDQLARIQGYVQQIAGLTLGKIDGDDRSEREQLIARPPALLVTNFVMLDHLLTNPQDWPLFRQSRDTLRYVVLDELHSYTGTKAAHLRHMLARLEGWLSHKPQYIGASATLGRGEAAERDMRKFVSDLWRTEPEQCVIIRPTEIPAEVEPTWSPEDWTSVTPPPGTFHTKMSDLEACHALTAMTGTPCSRDDLYAKTAEAFGSTAACARMRWSLTCATAWMRAQSHCHRSLTGRGRICCARKRTLWLL